MQKRMQVLLALTLAGRNELVSDSRIGKTNRVYRFTEGEYGSVQDRLFQFLVLSHNPAPRRIPLKSDFQTYGFLPSTSAAACVHPMMRAASMKRGLSLAALAGRLDNKDLACC